MTDLQVRIFCDVKISCRISAQVQLPHGTYGRIAGRSGLALKTHVVVGAGKINICIFIILNPSLIGVIDADYTGNIGIVLFNHGTCDLVIAPGDRVAQLICERISYPVIQEVFDEPTPTERGSDGFGSTELMN